MGDATSSSGQGTKASHSITLGGKPSASAASNNGAQAMVIHQGAIVTAGARDFGIVVQSVGGGGGLVSGDVNSLSAVTFTPGARGDGGDVAVSLSNGASVRTQGDGAFGVLAQSVGGGGGFAADSTQASPADSARTPRIPAPGSDQAAPSMSTSAGAPAYPPVGPMRMASSRRR